MNDLIVRQVDKARALLWQAKDAPQAKKVADMAHAAEIYAKRQKLSQESIDLAHGVKIDAMTLLGAFLSNQPKVNGARGIGKKVESQNGTPLLKDCGISKKESSLSQKLFTLSKTEPEKHELIRSAKTPITSVFSSAHVSHNSGENEWYTPPEYIEAAREFMVAIDLDPASSEKANEVVKARKFFSKQDNGLKQKWHGRIWMNPPYESGLVDLFCEKLVASKPPQAVCLVNNATETRWFQSLAKAASCICFPSKRVRFWSPSKMTCAPLQGQAILYIGGNTVAFPKYFSKFGFCANVIH